MPAYSPESLGHIKKMGTQADSGSLPELIKGAGSLGRVPRRRASEEKLHGAEGWGPRKVPFGSQPGTDEHTHVRKVTEAGWDEIVPDTRTSQGAALPVGAPQLRASLCTPRGSSKHKSYCSRLPTQRPASFRLQLLLS